MGYLFYGKMSVLLVFLLSVIYVHFRGKARPSLLREYLNPAAFFAPFNMLFYLFSGVSTKPRLDVKEFPELKRLQENWQTIREEAKQLYQGQHIEMGEQHNDVIFRCFFRSGWKRFNLKWYAEPLPSAKALCPKTVALIESIPSINAALFAALEPRSKVYPHRDPCASSLRYHLGLSTPNDDACRIVIDGEPYTWRDGEAVLFDQTYVHQPINETEQTRIILFCDVHRPMRFPMRTFSWFFNKYLAKAAGTRNVPTEKLGALNTLFGFFYPLHLWLKRWKQKYRMAFYVAKIAIFAVLLYLVFLVDFVSFGS